MKNFTYFLAFLIILISCNSRPSITDRSDYEIYLAQSNSGKHLASIDAEIVFWEKRLEKMSDDIISRSKLAGLLEKRFDYSGNITEIHAADSLFRLVNRIQSKNSSGTFRALAANCIRQHKFRQAQLYIDSAFKLGDDKYLTVLMEFDVALELGNKSRASNVLKSLVDKNSFDYLIRAAKYKDHIEGNLDEAITFMEKACGKVKNNEQLYVWAKSNLADMYGHANRLRESYKGYLDVLSVDKEYYHALKGIAWIAFSGDKNTSAAKDILNYLANHHPVPDYDLLLAEIADYENNQKENDYRLHKFLSTIQSSGFGNMYNKYHFNLKADEQREFTEALKIAENEVQNRPTPEAFSWLAWAYYKKGDIAKALEIVRSRVEHKSFEPEVMYRLGIIYKNSGQKNKARKYLAEAHASSYELGPVAERQIARDLHSF